MIYRNLALITLILTFAVPSYAVTPTGPIFTVTGTTPINLMSIPETGWSGQVTIIPAGALPISTGGTQSGLSFPSSTVELRLPTFRSPAPLMEPTGTSISNILKGVLRWE